MISKTVRDAVKAQLSASGSGLNDRLNALAGGYGIDPAYGIDWSTESTNFIFGRVSPDKFAESSVFTFPLLTIDTVTARNINLVKYATFSGPVIATIDVHHSWADESVIGDFASVVDLTEDAVFSCLNDKNFQTWPGNLLLNGNVSSQRSAIAMGGQGWLQSLQFLCTFQLSV